MLSVGDKAPEIRSLDQAGNSVVLSELWSKGPLVVYFYPKDFTRVCTQQACMFQDMLGELEQLESSVVGVSLDSADSHRKFAERHDISFPLLADVDKQIAAAFGVLGLFKMIAKRATFVIDRTGTVRAAFRHELSAAKHIDDVREALRSVDAAS